MGSYWASILILQHHLVGIMCYHYVYLYVHLLDSQPLSTIITRINKLCEHYFVDSFFLVGTIWVIGQVLPRQDKHGLRSLHYHWSHCQLG